MVIGGRITQCGCSKYMVGRRRADYLVVRDKYCHLVMPLLPDSHIIVSLEVQLVRRPCRSISKCYGNHFNFRIVKDVDRKDL